jgi:PTH1 family peptidyl-tRNA hydrolase
VWLVVGLGNPGKKYERNRHNVGFRVVDELVRRHGLGPLREKFKGEAGSGLIAGHKVAVLKPMEFMNLSGFAVQRAVQFHDVEPAHLVVVHDEIDLPFGKLRIKAGGGHGGHNGLRSIHAQLGSPDYLRVRVGVGRSSNPAEREGGGRGGDVAGHVLSDFPAAMAHEVDDLLGRSADAVEAILARGVGTAMNQFNGDTKA